MFVRRDYRCRALGAIAALVVLVVGVMATGAIGSTSPAEAAVKKMAQAVADKCDVTC